MKQELIAVSKKNHKNFFFSTVMSPQSNFEEFRTSIFSPILIDEVMRIASQYPVAFQKTKNNKFILVCFFSLLKNINPFINSENHWLGEYIPISFRTYPFLLDRSNDDREPFLCFNPNSSNIKESNTPDFFPFFLENGDPSDQLQKILGILKVVEDNKSKTIQTIESLANAELITEWPIEIRLNDGSFKIEGLHKIDAEKLQFLNKEQQNQLFSNEALKLAYAQLISINNLSKLKEMHTKVVIDKNSYKNIREITVEKQQQEKKKELDSLVQDLFDTE